MRSRRDFSDSSGSMVLALMLTVLLVSVSLIALSVLTWQLKKTQTFEADWETQVALNSGISWAAQSVGSVGSDTSCATITAAYPTTVPSSWSTNTSNAIAASANEAVATESGLYRWYISSCTASADGKIGVMKVKVDATNKNALTRSQNTAVSNPLQSVTLVFKGQKLQYVINN